MASVQLTGNVVDQNEVPVEGALVYIYDDTGSLADLTDALAAPLDNPVTTGEDGYWSATVPAEGFYTARYFWGGRERRIDANLLAGRDPISRAETAADFAEGYSGPVYADITTGEAATTEGQIFRVSNGDGPPETTTAYRRTAGGSVAQSPLATTAALASTDAGKGAGMVAGAVSAVRLTDYGAVGDDSTDNATAWANAVAAAVAQSKALFIPAGTYQSSAPFDASYDNLRIFGEGRYSILKYTGSGAACFTADAGDLSYKTGNIIENLTIEGSGAAGQSGFYNRGMVRAIRRNIRVRNVTLNAFHVLGDVLSVWDSCISTNNEAALTYRPVADWVIDGTGYISETTAVTFINCQASSGTEKGWDLIKSARCRWTGGDGEGIGSGVTGVGVHVGADSVYNTFDSFHMELNKGGDAQVFGKGTKFTNCMASSRAVADPYTDIVSISVESGAIGTIIENTPGYYFHVKAGAVNTTIEHCELDHSINDEGTGTVISDCLELNSSATRYPSRTFGNIADSDPLALDWYEEGTFTPTIGGSTGNGDVGLSVDVGHFQRVGNRVRGEILVSVSAINSAPTGDLWIRGLPYTANGAQNGTATILQVANLTFTGQLSATVIGGTTAIRFHTAVSAGAGGTLDGSALGSTTISLGFDYEVA